MSNKFSATQPSNVQELLSKLAKKEIDPSLAVKQFETGGFTKIGEVVLGGAVETLPTGFPSLDRFEVLKQGQGELVVLGARPSMGKSAIMFQMAFNVAKDHNVAIVSLEMGEESVKRRLCSVISKRPTKTLFTQAGKRDLELAEAEIRNRNLFIRSTGSADINTLRSTLSGLHKHFPLSLIVVDYLQIVRSRDLGNKNNEIGEVSSGLKSLAMDCKCPVLVGSQLNREVDRRGKDPRNPDYGDFRPQLSDLRDSGNIEQDADVVVFLSRPEYYQADRRPGEADIRVAKNRNGETGDVSIKFSRSLVRFSDEVI